jgi:orotate phosphoribosyltransferase
MVTRGVDELSEILLRTGCIKFGTFKLSSGALSSYYVDLRLIPSHPEALKRVIGFYTSLLKGPLLKRTVRFAGIPTAGIPYAAVLAFNLGKPFLYVRKEPKEHGHQRRIEGFLSPGDKILVLDDVITTGMNVIDAIQAIRSEGGVVQDAVVLLDRQQGGASNLKKMGVRLHSYCTITKVADSMFKHGTIEKPQYREILAQVTD